MVCQLVNCAVLATTTTPIASPPHRSPIALPPHHPTTPPGIFRRVLKLAPRQISNREINHLFAFLTQGEDPNRPFDKATWGRGGPIAPPTPRGYITINELSTFFNSNGEDGENGKAASEVHAVKTVHHLSEETVELIRHRWAAASYTTAGQNWQALFDKEDADHSGELFDKELKGLIRRVLKLTMNDMSDGDITRLFKKLDKDHSGSVSVEELFVFLDHSKATPESGGGDGAASSANARGRYGVMDDEADEVGIVAALMAVEKLFNGMMRIDALRPTSTTNPVHAASFLRRLARVDGGLLPDAARQQGADQVHDEGQGQGQERGQGRPYATSSAFLAMLRGAHLLDGRLPPWEAVRLFQELTEYIDDDPGKFEFRNDSKMALL